MAVMPIPIGNGELVADSEGVVHSALGESYVIGARRHPRGVSTTQSIQRRKRRSG